MLDTKLIAFLEGKRPDESYDYHSVCSCAAAQFNDAIGRRYPLICAVQDKSTGTPTTFDGRLEKIASEEPRTFGAMLERARKEFEPA